MARKTFAGSYLELRYNTYFAVLYVPKDVRHIIGKSKFYKTTETGNIQIAENRAAAMVHRWKQAINKARANPDDPLMRSAMDLASLLDTSSAPDSVREIIEEEEERIRRIAGDFEADVFTSIASGKYRNLKVVLEDWQELQIKRGLKKKTVDQMVKHLEVMISHFPTGNGMTEENVTKWIDYVWTKGDLTSYNLNRILGSCRKFYNYLIDIDEPVNGKINPFITPRKYKNNSLLAGKSSNGSGSWIPFTSEEIVSLYNKALNKKDIVLADLIVIAAHTGARIEELCSLKCRDVNIKNQTITFIDTKTTAGNRTIPIHKDILNKVEFLFNSSIDNYILSGLTFNKYGDRSNAIGKRFGRLKNSEGHESLKVFHSIRKTLTTLLENSGVSENIAADIVGHEKPRITYGLYSGGASVDVMREALNRISYVNMLIR